MLALMDLEQVFGDNCILKMMLENMSGILRK
jgi:hypothetical protein